MEKQSTQQNRTNPGSTKIQRTATALVLLSSILPFLNNIVKHFIDSGSIILVNSASTKQLDLDSAIFFLAVPFSYLFIAIGARLGAHKNSYYAVFVSCYFQLFLTVNFIFNEKKMAYIITQISLFVICVVVALLFVVISKYYQNIEDKNHFLNKTLDRYSEVLRNRK